IFCRCSLMSRASYSPLLFPFGPSLSPVSITARQTLPATLPSADFCTALARLTARAVRFGPKDPQGIRCRPPEVSSIAFRTSPPDFTPGALDGYGLRGNLPARPAPTASHPVLVHWLVRLLCASFRPHLAMAALARRYPSPPSGWREDFHLASYRTCSAHRVRSQNSPAYAALDCDRRSGSEGDYAVADATASLINHWLRKHEIPDDP